MNLKDIPLFSHFKDSDFERLQPCLHEKKFKKHELLFHEGQCCERVFIVREGRVKIYKIAESGREQIFEVLEAGQSCVCNPGKGKWDCSASGEALTDCTVWFLNRNDFAELTATNERLSKGLVELFTAKMQNLRDLVGEVSLQDVNKRLIRFLLDLHHKQSADAEQSKLSISFTREELAQRLGTTRETVTRYLAKLKDDRLIDMAPSEIRILSASGLQERLDAPAK